MDGLGNADVFARNLRHYVDASGQLGKDIAAVVGVATSTFSEWMNGKKYPRIDKIEMLANYFHIQKSDLIEDHSDAGTMPETFREPKTPENRIVSANMDDLPQDDREVLLSVFMAMMRKRYPERFEKGDLNET